MTDETLQQPEQTTGDLSPSQRRPVLILGLGNPLCGDDGVGPVAVRMLQERDLPAGVEVLDGGTAGLGLLSLIADRQHVLVVDAVEMGRPAGTVARMPLDEASLVTAQGALSPHQLGLAEVLELAGRLGMALPRVVILAVQPASLSWEQKLSQPVQESMPALVEAVLEELDAVGRDTCPRRRNDGQEDPGQEGPGCG
jgi:hydrogenase maturation protease